VRLDRLIALIGALTVLLSLPIAYMLVYGIFTPIRQLVDAARKMAAGRLDIRLQIKRGDLIGGGANINLGRLRPFNRRYP